MCVINDINKGSIKIRPAQIKRYNSALLLPRYCSARYRRGGDKNIYTKRKKKKEEKKKKRKKKKERERERERKERKKDGKKERGRGGEGKKRRKKKRGKDVH